MVQAGAQSVQQLVLAWLASRRIYPISKSSNEARITANLAACVIAPKMKPGEFVEMDGNEMVAMCGGVDEFAAKMKESASKLNVA